MYSLVYSRPKGCWHPSNTSHPHRAVLLWGVQPKLKENLCISFTQVIVIIFQMIFLDVVSSALSALKARNKTPADTNMNYLDTDKLQSKSRKLSVFSPVGWVNQHMANKHCHFLDLMKISSLDPSVEKSRRWLVLLRAQLLFRLWINFLPGRLAANHTDVLYLLFWEKKEKLMMDSIPITSCLMTSIHPAAHSTLKHLSRCFKTRQLFISSGFDVCGEHTGASQYIRISSIQKVKHIFIYTFITHRKIFVQVFLFLFILMIVIWTYLIWGFP